MIKNLIRFNKSCFPFVGDYVALEICRNWIGEIILIVTGMMVCIPAYFQSTASRG